MIWLLFLALSNPVASADCADFVNLIRRIQTSSNLTYSQRAVQLVLMKKIEGDMRKEGVSDDHIRALKSSAIKKSGTEADLQRGFVEDSRMRLEKVGDFRTNGTAHHVIVDGDTAYVADGVVGVTIVDLKTHSKRSIKTLDSARYLEKAGTKLYVADGGAGLTVLDLNDLSAPPQNFPFTRPGVDGAFIRIADGKIFLSTTLNGIFQYSLTTGEYEQYFSTPGMALGVDAADGVIYIADGTSGLLMIDTKNDLRVTIDKFRSARTVNVVGDKVFIGDEDVGLIVYDRKSLTEVHRYAAGSKMLDVFFDNTRAVIAEGHGGFSVVDLKQPGTLSHFPPDDTSKGYLRTVWLADGFVYGAGLEDGLIIRDIGL